MSRDDLRADEQPDPRFVEHLEWELARAVRREGRSFEGTRRRAPRRGLRRAAALLLAVTAGVSGVLAAQELRRSRTASLLAEQYRVRLELATLHVQSAREVLERLEILGEAGRAGAPLLDGARARADDAAHEAELLRFDAEEVALTGREPDRRLSAAPVAGHDFVRRRLDAELGLLRRHGERAARNLERLSALHGGGVATDEELAGARLLLAQATDQEASVTARRELRARFLAGELGAQRVELLGLEVASRVRLAAAQAELERSHRVAERFARLAAVGRAAAPESRAADAELRASQARVRLAELELATLEARLEETR